jgi:hypothetical protein
MPSIQVERGELLAALQSVQRLPRLIDKAEAILSLEDGTLIISVPGLEVRAGATGDLTGRVRVLAPFLLMLAKVPPSGDPVVFEIKDGRLKVGSSTTSCKWEDDAGTRIRLPLNAPFSMILSVAYHYTPGDIEQAGLKDMVAETEKRRDALIGQALGALGEFGITRAELRALVDAKMKQTEKP